MTATLIYTLALAAIFIGKKVLDYFDKNFRTYP